ncbi:SMP-30/gluconolactonase/LRE family protein [Streptomyces sp. NPDC020807]|uniref:SMP-30/gluconolactonase/LRE family protein n=1 Tax=Streptomyces sp. NPDC020807 TaxID=3155119 RepID=UPI0033E2CB0A
MRHLRAVPCAPPPGRLAEGPVWDDRRGELLWVDILEGRVHRAELATCDGLPDPKTPDPKTPDPKSPDLKTPDPKAPDLRVPDLKPLDALTFDAPVGAVALCASGALLLTAGLSVRRLEPGRPAAEAVELAALPPSADGRPRRMNDAGVDPAGRLLAGTMAYDETPGAGALYRLDGEALTPLLPSVGISNGLGWSPDGTRLYYADSLTGRVDVFAYDVGTGELRDRTPFAALERGVPDGLTVDSEGRVWVASWGGGEVLAHAPDGSLHARVEVPAAHVTSCAFAGPDLDVLVITTATAGLDAAARRAQPDAGRLFACRPGATGLPAARYADR